MEQPQAERRSEPRYPVGAKVTLRAGERATIAAIALNISDTGMSLNTIEATDLRVGEEVTVEVELEDNPEHAFSTWGMAKIVRIAGSNLGIQFNAAAF